MGFLHKLWDETLAGPPPESGLGKLRKFNSFSAAVAAAARTTGVNDTTPVSRSITVIRTDSTSLRNVNVSADSGSVPSSPATPGSPFSLPGTPRGDFRRHTRRKVNPPPVSMSSEGYDWIVLSALDR